jgi:hypothetical protein
LASISRAVKTGVTSTVADLPTFAFGEPLSDIDDVTEHVKSMLELRGYAVATYAGSHAIVISWGPAGTRSATRNTADDEDNGADDDDDASQGCDRKSWSRRRRSGRKAANGKHVGIGDPEVDCQFDVGL